MGAMLVLLAFPFELLGTKFLWWTWHDTDPLLTDRVYGVPFHVLFYHLCFGFAFNAAHHSLRRCENVGWKHLVILANLPSFLQLVACRRLLRRWPLEARVGLLCFDAAGYGILCRRLSHSGLPRALSLAQGRPRSKSSGGAVAASESPWPLTINWLAQVAFGLNAGLAVLLVWMADREKGEQV